MDKSSLVLSFKKELLPSFCFFASETGALPPAFSLGTIPIREASMRGILLWAIGIPIPVIILLYLFHLI